MFYPRRKENSAQTQKVLSGGLHNTDCVGVFKHTCCFSSCRCSGVKCLGAGCWEISERWPLTTLRANCCETADTSQQQTEKAVSSRNLVQGSNVTQQHLQRWSEQGKKNSWKGRQRHTGLGVLRGRTQYWLVLMWFGCNQCKRGGRLCVAAPRPSAAALLL